MKLNEAVDFLRADDTILTVDKIDENGNGTIGKREKCKSINAAKRRSRELQAQGKIVRRVYEP